MGDMMSFETPFRQAQWLLRMSGIRIDTAHPEEQLSAELVEASKLRLEGSDHGYLNHV